MTPFLPLIGLLDRLGRMVPVSSVVPAIPRRPLTPVLLPRPLFRPGPPGGRGAGPSCRRRRRPGVAPLAAAGRRSCSRAVAAALLLAGMVTIIVQSESPSVRENLNQVSSVPLLMTASAALANKGLFELTRLVIRGN